MPCLRHSSIVILVFLCCINYSNAQTTSSTIAPTQTQPAATSASTQIVATPVVSTTAATTLPSSTGAAATAAQGSSTAAVASPGPTQATTATNTVGGQTAIQPSATVTSTGTPGSSAAVAGTTGTPASTSGTPPSSGIVDTTAAGQSSLAPSGSATAPGVTTSYVSSSIAGSVMPSSSTQTSQSAASAPSAASSSVAAASSSVAAASSAVAPASSSVVPTASSAMPSSSVAATTPAPTASSTPVITTQPALPTKYPSVAGNIDVALFTLALTVKSQNCNNTALETDLHNKLNATVGFVSMKALSGGRYDVSYRAKKLHVMSENVTIQMLKDALSSNALCFNYSDAAFGQALNNFAAQTSNYCAASYICNIGYTCQMRHNKPLCTSICENNKCQNGGVCNVVIENNVAAAKCSCVSTYETIYTGTTCEIGRMNPERVAAIVGGVLGGVCFILFVALYCMCYRKRNSSGKKYQLSGVYNETYDNANVDMKTL